MIHCVAQRTSLTRIRLIFAVAVLAACESGGTARSSEIVTDTINGIETIRNAGVPPVWTFEPALRIGAVESGPAAFGRIRSITADADGNIYVADNLAYEIRVFDRRGAHVRTIGRRGGGPGEFNRVALPFVRILSDGAADTIETPRRPSGARTSGTLCRRTDGGITGITVPEAPSMVWAFPPPGGSIAASWTESYRIAFMDERGDTSRIVVRDVDLPSYPDSLWTIALEPFDELHRDFPGSSCEPSSLERPRRRAALRHIMFDDAGRMWVESARNNGFAWDVFDADGRLLGSAPALARSTAVPPLVRDNVLYQVETDDLGVQYVASYVLRDG